MASDEDLNCVVSAPGKVILFGEHSVVYKKAAVSTSISRRLYVHFRTGKGTEVSFKLSQINTEIYCNLKDFDKVVKERCPMQNSSALFSLDKPEMIDHDEYVKSLNNNLVTLGICDTYNILPEKTRTALIGLLFVMRGMCHTLQCNLVPFSMDVKSDLEVGAGTGSSASFAVAISGSILNYRKWLEKVNKLKNSFPKEVNDNVVISSYTQKSGFSLEEVKIVNKWAFCVEKIMHGHPSGIDNTTCSFGSVVITSQEQNRPGELIFRFLDNIPKISILLVSTGVSRNTSNLVAKVRQLRDNNCAAVDAIMNAMDVIAKEAFKTLHALDANPSSASKNMELYKGLGGLMELNHGLLRTLGVSHESLEQIINVTSQYGFSSKLTGAGGGGYAITLLPQNFSKKQIDQLKEELGSAYKVTEINIAEEGIRLEQCF